jgi:predicted DNA-binding protein
MTLPAKQRRTAYCHFRLSAETKRAVKACARRLRRTVSSYVESLVSKDLEVTK